MWASLHLHEGAGRGRPSARLRRTAAQLIDNRTNKQIGIRPKVQIIKAAGSGAQAVRSAGDRRARRPKKAPVRAAVVSATRVPQATGNDRPSRRRGRIVRRGLPRIKFI